VFILDTFLQLKARIQLLLSAGMSEIGSANAELTCPERFRGQVQRLDGRPYALVSNMCILTIPDAPLTMPRIW
jgi:hypothetical protein